MKKGIGVRDQLCWVVGLARSGCAAGALLRRHGAHVIGLDDADEETLHRRWDLAGLQLLAPKAFDKIFTGGIWPSGETSASLEHQWPDLIVISPGVPTNHPRLAALPADVPVIGELELGGRFCQSQIVAITGTNGKTTTTEWVAHIGRTAGLDARAVGNVGRPFCDVADSLAPEAVAVIEASSFQLENVFELSPKVGAVLNLAPDHLDRYTGLADYYQAKKKMADIVPASGTFVTSADCQPALDWPTKGQRQLFGTGGDVAFVGGRLVAHGDRLLASNELAQQSPPNLLNALAATTIGLAMNWDQDAVVTGLKDFPGLPDRHEWVAQRGKVKFINDTKATNVHAVCTGLSGFVGRVVLIAGGSGKGEDYSPLREVMNVVDHVVLIGAEGSAIAQVLQDVVPTSLAASMSEAVSMGADLAEPEAAVLLSPACASFDMYANYQERGAAFVAAALAVGAVRKIS
ncbi:MAG: UDP-N-acetylmuramoylalanine--D-glutamate ligase [Candidatus Krumholzibacteriia bacterium]|jgi:UDP-N-acetylmuramoylalanine--D-glutamate ligase